MPRRIRLRPLTRLERNTLSRKLKDLSLSARIHHRYRVIEEVRRGRTPVDAADRVGCHFSVAYDWVERFNESGFRTFEQVPNPRGRPPILAAAQLTALLEIARSHPEEHGLPYAGWSVAKLAAYCRDRGVLPAVSDEWVRRLLRREGVTLRHRGRGPRRRASSPGRGPASSEDDAARSS